MAYRPRLSPSGPFLPQSPSQFGYISRIWYDVGPDVIANVLEGAPGPPGTILVDIPIVVAAADLADLTWEAEAEVRYAIEIPEPEDPRLFALSFTLGVQPAGAPAATPVIVNDADGWPHFPVLEDGGNANPVNLGLAHWVWDAASFPMLAGTNHVVCGLTFFGGGPAPHTAIVQVNQARLTVREYRGTTYTPP
jgi:hypothetical protein